MHMLRVALSVVGLVTIASPRAQAQEAETLSAAQRAGLALARLGGGQRVRIRAGGDGFVQGWISNSPNLVTLRTADRSTIEVPAPGVDSLWVRGTHARTGALVGGVAGLGLGAFLVTNSNPYTARNTVAGGLGLVGGGVIGALIGAAVPRWQLRVP